MNGLEERCLRCSHQLWLHQPVCVAAFPQGEIRPGPTDFIPCTCRGADMRESAEGVISA